MRREKILKDFIMKKFITHPKVFAEVHGGIFLWESFRIVLTIAEQGKVVYRKEPISPNPSSQLTLTGHMVSQREDSWLEIHIFRDDSSKKMILNALEVGDNLICSIYSEFNQSSSSEIFYREK